MSNLSVLDGTYSNTHADYVDNITGKPLYTFLFEPFRDYKWQEVRDYSGEIKLKALSDKKLSVEYRVGDKIINQRTLKGKIVGNNFVVKRKISVIPFFPIVWSYKERLISISLTPENYLRVTNGRDGASGVLIMVGGGFNWAEKAYYGSEKVSDDIYTRTSTMYKNLASAHPGKMIFYKTEINSINSFVWYHEADNIILHHYTPEGENIHTIKVNPRYNLHESIFPQTPDELQSTDKTIIGYALSDGNRTRQYYINTTMDKLACYPYREDNFIDSVRNDLNEIKKVLPSYLVTYYCSEY